MNNVLATPPRRIFRSTLVVFALVLGMGVLVNLGEDYDPKTKRLTRGWPYTFTVKEFVGHVDYYNNMPVPWFDLWSWKNLDEFRAGAYVANLAIVIALAAGLACGWQLRRAKRQRLWQFSLLDCLWAITLMAGVLTWGRWVYGDNITMERIDQGLKRGESDAGHRNIWHVDYPQDWFWDTLGVPAKYRPLRVRCLGVVIVDTPSAGTIRDLAKFRALKELDIWVFGNATLAPSELRQWDSGWGLQRLEIDGADVRDEHLAALPPLPALRAITLKETRITDQGISHLSRHPKLEDLELDASGDVSGTTLLELTSLRELNVCERVTTYPDNAGLETKPELRLKEEGLAAIAKLPALRSVIFDGCRDIRAQGWANLGKSRSIKNLTIERVTLHDDEVEAIVNLKSIPEVILIRIPTTPRGAKIIRLHEDRVSLRY